MTDFDTSSKSERRCAELTATRDDKLTTAGFLRPKSGLTVRDTDRMLIACQGGDREAFSGLYRLTSPQLFGLAIRILRRRDWAEEAVQECFVTIWRRAKDYRPDLGPALPWITVILRNKCLDRLRREKPLQPLDESAVADRPDEGPSPLEGAMAADDARRLKGCVDQLDEDQQRSIRLAYYEGLTHEELAARLAAPLGTVKSWIRRGLQRLKRCLES
ncbi:MAG TPA: sigma-70 family RNA polymerase sigma factor [Dongiaceae bacterium]|nr:sigma-70 family RNA polymerase sigma factor [Dongiaceae bacterium]